MQSIEQLADELSNLLDIDPARAVQLALQVPLTSKSHRSLRAAILTDGGIATGNVDAVREGRDLYRALLDETKSEEMAYNLANAIGGLCNLDRTPRPRWFETTREPRHEVRRLLHAAATSRSLPPERRTTAWTNLGNALKGSERLSEAYDAFRDALHVDPANGVAAGQAALLLYQMHEKGFGSAHLGAEASALAAHAVANRERVVAYAGARAAELYEELSRRLGPATAPESTAPPTPRERFIAEHRLWLAPSIERVFPGEGPADYIMLGSVLERTPNPGPSTPPIFAMFNMLKAEFIVARELAIRALHEDWQVDARFADTMDYAVYGPGPASLVLAQRAALDVLDKVAVALNDYLELGNDPEKVNFRRLWRAKPPKNLSLHPTVEQRIAAGLPSLVALVELADDLYDGYRKPVQTLRNAGTHRFVVLHDEGVVGSRASQSVEHFTVRDFGEATIDVLRTVRSAIQYMKGVVEEYEAVLRVARSGRVVSLHVPDHDWVRGRR
jgi:hypothetical protein